MRSNLGRCLAMAFAFITGAFALAPAAHARCNELRLERFLESRFFRLPAERKIQRYADEILRYYDDRNISSRAVLAKMQDWEDRWPDRIYKFMHIHDFEETEDRSACRVTFDYKFLAYSDERDQLSAGVGRTTLVLADLDFDERMRIVAEWGSVLCRGVRAFEKGRC
ncbi:MAG: hypothetical protein GC150_10235 [Rhizobiales bacterium]|nr:hypothetical protein [Hyphomicrobiales bacterium]